MKKTEPPDEVPISKSDVEADIEAAHAPETLDEIEREAIAKLTAVMDQRRRTAVK